MISITVIGISNSGALRLPEELWEQIHRTRVFSGGKRHYAIVRSFLPEGHAWITISANVQAVLQQYRALDEPLIVFASGDPLFYGIANTIRRAFPNVPMRVHAHHNALQLLSHRFLLDYSDMCMVSVHGRDWHALDEMLIRQAPLIGVLTDRQHSPARIAQRLLQHSFDNYDMLIGEDLEGAGEKLHEVTLHDAANLQVAPLNCIALRRTRMLHLPFGIPDEAFATLADHPNMITKRPFRLLALQALELKSARVFWDVGYCTGSVSIEAKRQFPHLQVYAVEKRYACEALIQRNMEVLHTPGIQHQTADFFEFPMEESPAPDAVFIGGHGGRLEEMMLSLHRVLTPGGHVVMNAVTEESERTFQRVAVTMNYRVHQQRVQIDRYNPITILKAEKL